MDTRISYLFIYSSVFTDLDVFTDRTGLTGWGTARGKVDRDIGEV